MLKLMINIGFQVHYTKGKLKTVVFYINNLNLFQINIYIYFFKPIPYGTYSLSVI